MPIKHTKRYGLYHWDTFDNTTSLRGESDSFHEILDKAKKMYKERFSVQGADVVEIVNEDGMVVKKFQIK